MYNQNTQHTNLLLEQFQLEELEERTEFSAWDQTQERWEDTKYCGLGGEWGSVRDIDGNLTNGCSQNGVDVRIFNYELLGTRN